MDSKIEFEKKIKHRKIDGARYEGREILLKINGEFFNQDTVTPDAKRIQRKIHKRYWDTINKFYLNDCTMVVRLSGLHFNLDDVKKYLFVKNSRRDNMILHYLRWVVQEDEMGGFAKKKGGFCFNDGAQDAPYTIISGTVNHIH